jgi:hypothetical protein
MRFYIIILLLFAVLISKAQTQKQWAIWNERESLGYTDTVLYKKDYKDKYSAYNYSGIWTARNNLNIVGFIGNNYQRIRIKFISITKESTSPDSYFVIGKTMVKNTICNFKGEIKITNIKLYKHLVLGYGEEGIVKKRGILFGDYCFNEDSTQKNSGIFKGSFSSCWFIDNKGQLCYDSLGYTSDAYCNNQFAGVWQQYNSQKTETCNWGDDRIPFSKDFDWGTGEFYPNKKYLNNGWESYKVDNYDEVIKAEKKYEKWWK